MRSAFDGGARDERQEGQRHAVARLEIGLVASRIFATRVISTLWTVVTCAEVRLLITMCSAILMRMVLIGSTRVLACPARWRGRVGAGGGAGAAAAGRGAARLRRRGGGGAAGAWRCAR